MKKLTLKEFNNRLKEVHPKEQLQALSYNGDKKDCEVLCLTCGTKYIKKSGCFLDKRKISICKKCFPTHNNVFKEMYELPEGYTYIKPYKGMLNKTLIQHKCGFIWEVKPNNLKYGKGCPKCNRKISKGEQKIIKYLDENNIEYQTQYKLELENHHLTIDFYLPKNDLYIEYNGEQHYNPVAFFGGIEKYNKQIYLDNLKKEFLKDKLLIISYLDFQNIENILKSSTTSYKT